MKHSGKKHDHFLSIYKIKIYLSISFSFLIIDEMQFTKILSTTQQQKNIKSINKAWFVNARAVPNNIKINVR
jgi:hypothetical protein